MTARMRRPLGASFFLSSQLPVPGSQSDLTRFGRLLLPWAFGGPAGVQHLHQREAYCLPLRGRCRAKRRRRGSERYRDHGLTPLPALRAVLPRERGAKTATEQGPPTVAQSRDTPPNEEKRFGTHLGRAAYGRCGSAPLPSDGARRRGRTWFVFGRGTKAGSRTMSWESLSPSTHSSPHSSPLSLWRPLYSSARRSAGGSTKSATQLSLPRGSQEDPVSVGTATCGAVARCGP